jgi:UDP-N-acetylmuramate--alanine ligase
VPGQHNLSNALAAMGMAAMIGTDLEQLKNSVAQYRGVKRRFEILMHTPTLTYIDDYAHHPTELEAAIGAARQLFPGRRLIVVFQPHLFTRTRDFAPGFARALSLADEVLLLHIYPARELSIPHVSAEMVFQQITNTEKHLLTLNEFPAVLAGRVRGPSVVLTLGAGDIDTQVETTRQLLARLEF